MVNCFEYDYQNLYNIRAIKLPQTQEFSLGEYKSLGVSIVHKFEELAYLYIIVVAMNWKTIPAIENFWEGFLGGDMTWSV